MKTLIDQVQRYKIFDRKEPNGNLAFVNLPFDAKRVFHISNVPTGNVRGFHAHKKCEQFLICMSGTVNVTCDDGDDRQMFTLSSPLEGLYIPPMIWTEQYYYSPDTMLVCLASHTYDESDYIRDYQKFSEVA